MDGAEHSQRPAWDGATAVTQYQAALLNGIELSAYATIAKMKVSHREGLRGTQLMSHTADVSAERAFGG